MNLTVEVLPSEEGPGYGAALLAAVGCKEYATIQEGVQSWIQVKETIAPEPELVEKYEKQYRKFQRIYPAMKELFHQLQGEE